ncbi:MAG: hypothetical protein MUC63_09125, partial [Planctomycetes bacterium]|nr:hypothetical protein [Planctomycetota bacterium]
LQHYVHYYRSFPAAAAAQAFRTVESLVRSCPVRTLRFRKDAEFWDVIPLRACLPAGAAGERTERKGRGGARRDDRG